jgi:hypothetical protein
MNKPTQDEIKKYYTQALLRALEGFSRLDDKEWNKKASDEWTARQHLGHLAVTLEMETLPLTRQALAGQPGHIDGFEKRADMLAFNKRTLETVKDVPVPELIQRLRAAVEQHLQTLEGLTEADLDKPASSPGWDRPGTLRDLYFGAYLFLPGQYQEIRRVSKKKLPHWMEASTPDQVNYQLARTFHYMPLIFNSTKGADVNAMYLFTMEGDGGGQWQIQVGGGKAVSDDGAPPSFDAEVRTKPELWMDLSHGDINPAFAIMTRKIHLGGNAGLAMKLGELFSVEG